VKLNLGQPAWREALPPTRSVGSDAPVAACAFNNDGTQVAFALGDGSVRLLPADPKAAATDATPAVHRGAVLSLVSDPTGDGFVSGGDDGRILRIALDGTTTELANFKGKWVDRMVAHKANEAIAAAVGRNAVVIKDDRVHEVGPHPSTVADGATVWSLANITSPPRRFAWRGSHVALRWSTDGKFIATGTQENDIHVWRLAQATDMRMQGYPTKVKSLSWSADARFLYTASQPVFTAWPFSGKGPEGKPPVQFGEEGAGLQTVVAAHPSAEFVAAGYDTGELQLGDIKTRRAVVLKLVDGIAITCLAWSPDGWRLAAGNDKGDLLVLDLKR
jgi:WD40 repeat protein